VLALGLLISAGILWIAGKDNSSENHDEKNPIAHSLPNLPFRLTGDSSNTNTTKDRRLGRISSGWRGLFFSSPKQRTQKRIPIPSPSFPEKLSSFSTHYESASPTNQAASNPK
jgi:hypothetical protein